MSAVQTSEPDYEIVRIEKTKSTCSLCEDYARAQSHKPIVVMSCEGACLRGEISRQAANHLCHALAPDKTVRLCLEGAFTKNGGQRDLVRNAARVVALEGCLIRCATRMMRGQLPDLRPEVFVTDGMCDFDRSLFGIDALPEEDVRELGRAVAAKIAGRLWQVAPPFGARPTGSAAVLHGGFDGSLTDGCRGLPLHNRASEQA